jgi:pantothenate kinase type III
MQQSLQQNTAALPEIRARYPLALSNTTEAAIASGTLFAAMGLIQQVLPTQLPASILITGGDAELIIPYLTPTAQFIPNLVLQGLAIYTNSVNHENLAHSAF